MILSVLNSEFEIYEACRKVSYVLINVSYNKKKYATVEYNSALDGTYCKAIYAYNIAFFRKLGYFHIFLQMNV